MSFDHITLALAKEYTDEKAGGGSGGGTRILDLNNYMSGENTLTFSLFYMFAVFAGDVSTLKLDDDSFWRDVGADTNPVAFLLDLEPHKSAVGADLKIYIYNVNKIFRADGTVMMLDFTCHLMYTDGKVYQMMVAMTTGGDGKTAIYMRKKEI